MRFLVGEGELDPRVNICIADEHIQGYEGDLAHNSDKFTVIARPAAVVDDLKPARPRVILRHETRGPVDGDVKPEAYLPHMHLVVPCVAHICPLDKPRVEREPHPCWDVASRYIVVSFARPVLRQQVPLGIFEGRPALVLNDWIRMKVEERILKVIPFQARDAATDSVYYLSPRREARSPPFYWPVATGPAGRCTRRLMRGGTRAPLRTRHFRLRWHSPLAAAGPVVGREIASLGP